MSKGSKQRKRLVPMEKYFKSYDQIFRKKCDICGGTGDVGNKLFGEIKCPRCKGNGKISKK